MSKIVYIGWNGYGHVNPTLSLVKSLVENGNEVLYFNSKEFKNVIEQTGAKYVRNRFLNMIYQIGSSDYDKKVRCSEEEFLEGVRKFYSNIGDIYKILDEVRKTFVSIQPDLIIHDSCTYFVNYICKDIDIPRICTLSLFATNKEMYLKDENMFQDFYDFKVSSSTKNVIDQIEKMERTSEKEYGFHYDFVDAGCNKCSLNLVFTSSDFQPYKECLDHTYKFIGNDINFRRSMEAPFVIEKRYEKTVLVSFGSTLSGEEDFVKFYQRFMEHFKNYNALFIINIGDINDSYFIDVPKNIILSHKIQQISTLNQVDLFISHGGFNSISEAILTNVPMIIVPQIIDQRLNARRVEELHLGKYYRDINIDMQKLEEEMNEMFHNENYQNNMKEMAKSYWNTGTNKYALKLIEEYMKAK